LACERPPRLRRFGGFATFFDGAATPPSQGGEWHSNDARRHLFTFIDRAYSRS
jgi:hypothetical protein